MTVTTLDGDWLIAIDPQNRGRDESWWRGPVDDARPTRVPWPIQATYPGYHGVAWYWRSFRAPAHRDPAGRYLLRFWAVDYLAEVWLNGTRLGTHEVAEVPFSFDATDAVIRNAENVLAVRVLNPTHEPIDGIVLKETPHRNKEIPLRAGGSPDHGGITDSVELVTAPAVRVEDLFAAPDARTGRIRLRIELVNALSREAACRLAIAVAPAASGETLVFQETDRSVPAGASRVDIEVAIEEPHIWSLGDPYLYRLTVSLVPAAGVPDERSIRCGFRDFRFRDGYFRLNDERIWLTSSHTGNDGPIGRLLPHDPALFRRDLIIVKTMGFTMIRFIAGMATRYQLDLCDEIGLLVYEECNAAWELADSPNMRERFNAATLGMVRRDRNHPSVVAWGLLNEVRDGPVFRHAVGLLPDVRALDDTRLVMLHSGRWDGDLSIGSLANPGSREWEHRLGEEAPTGGRMDWGWGGYFPGVGDAHAYPRVPHTAEIIRFLRTVGTDSKPVFLSEYGIGSAVDLWRIVKHYEQLGATECEDGKFYLELLDRFLADWERWRLDELYSHPSDYFAACVRKMADQRALGLDAIRSNPNIVGHNVTGTLDQGLTGEGLFTAFRELKPGTTDAISEAFAPARLCVFAEPPVIYPGGRVRLEAVLANVDSIPPGEHPVLVQVVGPGGVPVYAHRTTCVIPPRMPEPPLAQPVFSEELPIDGPPGEYRFVVRWLGPGAPTGGEVRFHVGESVARIAGPVALLGDDPELREWLERHGCRVSSRAKALLVSHSGKGEPDLTRLVERVTGGATAVVLTPSALKRGEDRLGWLDGAVPGELFDLAGWLYLKDEWAKRHAAFDGLPSGGLMEYGFWRDVIPDLLFQPAESPDAAIAGAARTSQDYTAGLMLSVHRVGAGRIVMNTLLVRENVGKHPAADRLLANLIAFARASEST